VRDALNLVDRERFAGCMQLSRSQPDTRMVYWGALSGKTLQSQAFFSDVLEKTKSMASIGGWRLVGSSDSGPARRACFRLYQMFTLFCRG